MGMGLMVPGSKMYYGFKCDGLSSTEWRLMEVKFNSCSIGLRGKPKRLHTIWALKKQPESKMKVDSQNPGEKNCSKESSSTSLILWLSFLLSHQVKAKYHMTCLLYKA